MLNVSFKVEEVQGLGDRLAQVVNRAAVTLAAIDAVNIVTKRASESLMRGETADIGLTPAYVRSKTDVALAVGKPRAEILTRGDLTIMGRYPIDQRYVPAKGKAKGDPKRGIPAGNKQAGLSVTIKRSAPVYESKWFTMTLRRGKAAGADVGVFARRGDSVRHMYGPSPYSLFRFQIGQQSEAIEADLAREGTNAIAAEVSKVLA